MFATSFANRKWQELFPELNLSEIANRYGIKYSDGSLFLLQHHLHQGDASKNIFVIGAPEHVKERGFTDWNLPMDALPGAVRPSLEGAWSAIGDRKPFGQVK